MDDHHFGYITKLIKNKRDIVNYVSKCCQQVKNEDSCPFFFSNLHFFTIEKASGAG
jgi:hypothetical protein